MIADERVPVSVNADFRQGVEYRRFEDRPVLSDGPPKDRITRGKVTVDETIAGKSREQGPGTFGVLLLDDGVNERGVKGTFRCGNVREECGRNPACIETGKRLDGGRCENGSHGAKVEIGVYRFQIRLRQVSIAMRHTMRQGDGPRCCAVLLRKCVQHDRRDGCHGYGKLHTDGESGGRVSPCQETSRKPVL